MLLSLKEAKGLLGQRQCISMQPCFHYLSLGVYWVDKTTASTSCGWKTKNNHVDASGRGFKHEPVKVFWYTFSETTPLFFYRLKMKRFLSLSDRYKIFASNWLWIEVCQNVVLTKIGITMTTISKKIGNW